MAVVDVITDAYCATIVAHLTKDDLEQMDLRHKMRMGLGTVVRVMSDILVPQLSQLSALYPQPLREYEEEEEEEEEGEEEEIVDIVV